MAKITAIQPQTRDPNRVNIHLDGHFAFSLAGILSAWLHVGQDLDEHKLASLQADDARERAYQQALYFLSYRPRSEAEIRQHLLKHKTSDEVIEDTLHRLRRSRLADDEQFARAWVDNRRTFRPRGRRALAWELRQKGISAELAEPALAGVDEADLAHQAGLKHAARLRGLTWNDFRTKLSAFLARRGFEYSIVSTTVLRLWDETHTAPHTFNDEAAS